MYYFGTWICWYFLYLQISCCINRLSISNVADRTIEQTQGLSGQAGPRVDWCVLGLCCLSIPSRGWLSGEYALRNPFWHPLIQTHSIFLPLALHLSLALLYPSLFYFYFPAFVFSITGAEHNRMDQKSTISTGKRGWKVRDNKQNSTTSHPVNCEPG